MLTDPEDQDEQPFQHDEPILAANLEEAKHICCVMAKKYYAKLVGIEQPWQVHEGEKQTYRCMFEFNSIE